MVPCQETLHFSPIYYLNGTCLCAPTIRKTDLEIRSTLLSNFTTVGVKTGAPLKPQKQEEKLSHSFKNAGPVLYLHFIKYY